MHKLTAVSAPANPIIIIKKKKKKQTEQSNLDLSNSQHSAKQESGQNVVMISVIAQPHLNL